MPKTRKPIYRNMLPIGYQNMTPSGGYPISSDVKSKTKLIFICDVCSNFEERSYDNILASPNRKQACGICEKAENIINRLHSVDDSVVVSSYYQYEKSKFYKSKFPAYAIKYQLTCRNFNHEVYDVSAARLQRYVNSKKGNIKCPLCAKEEYSLSEYNIMVSHRKKAENTIASIKDQFPDWEIDYLGYEKLNKNSSPPCRIFALTINIAANQRVEGDYLITSLPLSKNQFRWPLFDEFNVSEKRLKQIFTRSLKDRAVIDKASKDAKIFGSEIISVISKATEQLEIQYKNVVGIECNKATISRARENSFGRQGIRLGETYILVCLKLLFPNTNDWRLNRRDLFLGKSYEIDISSKSLKLCLEYQGHQAHRDYPTTKAIDAYKRRHCPWSLVVVKRMRHYSGQEVKSELVKALISSYFWVSPVQDIDPKKIDEGVKKILPETAQRATTKLTNGMLEANPKHVILTPKNKIIQSGKYDYICGNCGRHVTGVYVKHHIDRPPHGCRYCRTAGRRRRRG